MCVFIKEVALCNAYGHVSETCYIIQDPNMSPDECVRYSVFDLGSSMVAGAFGHLFVMKSRAANMKFNQIYFSKIVIPFIDDLRRTIRADLNLDYNESDLENDDSSALPVLLTFDGEKVQLDGFIDDDVIKYCSDNGIYLLKLAAGCTKIQQPLDSGNKFDSKKKNIRAAEEAFINPLLEGALKLILKQHSGISTPQAKVILEGLQFLNQADYRTLDRDKIASGWARTGIHPLDEGRILDNCTSRITSEDREYILRICPTLRDSFERHGMLSDSVMDELEIPMLETTKKSK